MITIGQFRETHNKKEYPSIMDAVRPTPPENKSKILAYLKNKNFAVAYAPGYLYDRISGDGTLIPNQACLTDGVYIWRSDLAYYFEKYNVELPEDFIKHVLKKR